MKLRLTAKGFEKYTGQMGVIQFKDGLSEGDVLPVDAVRVAGVIGAEWEDGSPANVNELLLRNMQNEAPVGRVTEQGTDEPPVEVESEEAPVEVVAEETPAEPAHVYTAEELAEVADKKGIAGLREIGDSIGVKGTSIVGLIEAILKAQEVAAAPKE